MARGPSGQAWPHLKKLPGPLLASPWPFLRGAGAMRRAAHASVSGRWEGRLARTGVPLACPSAWAGRASSALEALPRAGLAQGEALPWLSLPWKGLPPAPQRHAAAHALPACLRCTQHAAAALTGKENARRFFRFGPGLSLWPSLDRPALARPILGIFSGADGHPSPNVAPPPLPPRRSWWRKCRRRRR